MRKRLLLVMLSLTLSGFASAGVAQTQQNAGRLHDALKLDAAQEQAWQTYQAAIAQDPQQGARAQQAQMLMPTLTTPRRLALIRAQMQSNVEIFNQNAAAVLNFYGALGPEQQRIFDRETAAPVQPPGR